MDNFAQQIFQEVVDAIEQDGRVVVAGLEVTGTGGMINLTGTVQSYEARQAAEADAWNVAGVNFVKNNLRVRNADETMVDGEIEARVRDELSMHADLYREDIRVIVDEGILTLEGTVKDVYKKHRIQELIRSIPEVADFTDRVAVVPTAQAADETIALAVLRNLDSERKVDINTVTVTVEDGTVKLSGEVPSYESRSAAYETALRTPGVAIVRDEMSVKTTF